VHDHLGVRARREAVPAREQLLPQRLEVVDLAVEDHHHRPVLVEHGLVARGQVDDGQAAMTQPHPALEVEAVRVGPAMRHGRGHAPQELGRYGMPGIRVDDTGDAAHVSRPS
jgi:hypothetical protein